MYQYRNNVSLFVYNCTVVVIFYVNILQLYIVLLDNTATWFVVSAVETQTLCY